jgi:AcrR family transcriptional regulator
MDALAKEAGVARATVYEHFRSKRALLDELAVTLSRTVKLDEPQNPGVDPLIGLRQMFSDVCRHWSENEEGMRGLRTLAAVTGGNDTGDGVDDKQLRRLIEGLQARNRLSTNWSIDEAVDALSVLTSYASYDQLRRAPHSPAQVEEILAKLGWSITGQ